MTTSTLNNAVDTFTRQRLATKNYAQNTWLSTGGVNGDAHYAYIFFNRPFPLGATIISAKLQLTQDAPAISGTSVTLSCALVNKKYSVTSVNYNNMPGSTGTVVTKTSSSWPLHSVQELDVTALMQSVSNGTPWYGFRLWSTYNANVHAFSSAQNPQISWRPKLIVTWSTAPQAPDTLYPDGGRAITPALPVLRSNFHATDGATALNAIQVQVDNTAGGNFTSPTYDSGVFLTTTPEFDMTANLANTDATFDTGLGGFVAVSNCTIAQDTAVKLNGAGSLKMTATAAGDMQAMGPTTSSCTPGQTYTVAASERAATTARSVRIDICWRDAAQNLISTTTATSTDTVGAWKGCSTTGVAPAGATQFNYKLTVLAAAAGEVHNWDTVTYAIGSTATFYGLSDGQTGYWRLRVQDGSGQWSAWSHVASFKRAVQGSVTITSPPSGGISNDSTPPIVWTFANQSAYQVYVMDSSGKVVYDSGKITSTDHTFTVPDRVITRDNMSYEVHVRCWDSMDRESLPYYPAYVEGYTVFYYDYDAATSPATNLIKTVQSPYPWVQLDWARSAQPDEWEIQRDGVIIEKVSGYELLVAGTNYRYTDRSASPRDPHTWKVVAVTNNKSSANSPTVSATLPMETTLLAAVDGTNPVFLYNPSRDVGRAQVSQVFDVVGDNPPVLITQSLKGERGTIKGRISSLGSSGLTAAQQLANFKSLNEIQGTTMLLYYVNQGLKIVAYNFTWQAIAMGGGDTVYDCAFDYFEVDS